MMSHQRVAAEIVRNKISVAHHRGNIFGFLKSGKKQTAVVCKEFVKNNKNNKYRRPNWTLLIAVSHTDTHTHTEIKMYALKCFDNHQFRSI